MMPQLSVYINSPDKLIWEGRADWVSSENSQGSFDILPLHANFITIVENKPIRIKTAEKILNYKFTHSIVYNHNNKIFIYTGIT